MEWIDAGKSGPVTPILRPCQRIFKVAG